MALSTAPAYYFGAEQMICTINVLPISYLAVLIMLLKKVPWWSYLLSGAMLLLIAPMNSLVLFPMMVFALVKSGVWRGEWVKRELKGGVAWCVLALVTAVIALLYYARADDGEMPIMPVWAHFSSLADSVKFVLQTGGMALVAGYLPWRYLKEDRGWCWMAVVLIFLLPCLYIGKLNNEFLMKASPMVMCLLAVLWCRGLQDNSEQARRDVFVWLCIGLCAVRLVGFLWVHNQKILPHLLDWQYNECNPYQGHLFHPGMALDQSIPKTHAPLVPGVFYTHAGESERFFFRLVPTPPSSKYEEKKYIQSRAYRLDIPYGADPESKNGTAR